MGTKNTKAVAPKPAPKLKQLVGKFVSPNLALNYPTLTRIGASMTGMRFDTVEIVCELNELRDILTSVWFGALSRRRVDPEKPVKMTITTEIP